MSNQERGLSLVELLLSASILAIVALGVGATLAQTPRITRASRDEQAVRTAMLTIASQINAAPFSVVAATYNESGFDVEGLKAPKGDPDGMPGHVSFTYGDGGETSYYRVEIRVDWWDGKSNRSEINALWLANVRGDTGVPEPLATKTPYNGVAQ